MPEFLSSHLAQFFWGLSAFFAFAVILYRVAVKQVLAAVDAREAKIARELAESDDAFRKAQTLKSDLEAKMRGAEARIGELMTEARKNAAEAKEALLEKGRQEIEQVRIKSLREIEAARHAAVVALRAEVAEVATLVAAKAARLHIDAAHQVKLVDEAIAAAEAARTGAR
jgi:F-type H+-transporting ATPase subunit b